MLTFIRVKNFISIDHLELECFSGLTSFTGESGVGKSVLFKALFCLLGHSLTVSMIKANQPFAECEAQFDISNLNNALLTDYSDNDDSLIIYRKITAKKQQTIKINGKIVSQKMLKDAASQLAIIVNQHEQLSMLKPAMQLQLLDQLSPNITSLQADYLTVFADYQAVKQELNSLSQLQQDSVQYEFLQFQYDDICAQQFKPTEDVELIERKKKLQQSLKQKQFIESINKSLKQASQHLDVAQQLCDNLSASQSLADKLNMLDQAVESVADFNFHFDQWQSTQAGDLSMSIDDIEARLDLIFRYTSKYKVLNLRDLCDLQQTLEDKLIKCSDFQANYTQLQTKLTKIKASCAKKAQALTDERKQVAIAMVQSIEVSLKDLGILQPIFNVEFSPAAEFGLSGADVIEFKLSTLKGTQPQALHKVASGGELSRLLLAFYALFAQTSSPKLFLFDEIDTGVGGLIANAMAKTLGVIAQHHQLFCITHLAQIAAKSQQHIIIYKSENGSYTKTRYVDKQQQSTELQRMIGGETVIKSLVI